MIFAYIQYIFFTFFPLKNINSLFSMYECFACMHVYRTHESNAHRGQKSVGSPSPGTEGTVFGYWEWNLGSLEEQQVLLTTEFSLQSQTIYFVLSLFIENRICHIINSDYCYHFPNSSLFLPTSPASQIHTFCSLSL